MLFLLATHFPFLSFFIFFFFNDTATTEIYTLSLHDALPIYCLKVGPDQLLVRLDPREHARPRAGRNDDVLRSEEHTSELQSRFDLVCRLLLEKKKNDNMRNLSHTANDDALVALDTPDLRFTL